MERYGWLCLHLIRKTLVMLLSFRIDNLNRTDRLLLHIPKSFQELQDLNGLLKKYRDIYPYRIFICYVITYLLYVGLSHHDRYTPC